MVAASAGAVRTVASAEAQRFAVAVAQARVEELAARHCSTLRDGDARDSSRRMRERWTVTRYGNAVHLLTDSVEYLDRAAPRWAVARRLMVC